MKICIRKKIENPKEGTSETEKVKKIALQLNINRMYNFKYSFDELKYYH